MIRIALPFITPSLNQWAKWHWGKRDRFTKSCQAAVRAALNGSGRWMTAPPTSKIEVIVTRYAPGVMLDDDNLRGGAKGLIDALVREQLLYDDSPAFCEISYWQARAKRAEARTMIEIRP
jgi:hypothetical protein